MGSTYLDLTNRVLRRLNQVELTSSDFASARGIHAMAKDAILDTVRKINSQKFEWPFNATSGTQILTVGQELYSYPVDLRIPDWESFYIEKDDTLNINTKKLSFISKDQWYKYFRENDLDSETNGRAIPDYVFETDDGGFGVTSSPNEAYTVKFRYWIKTIDLETYDDVCTIPSEYDHVIMDGAMHFMYMFLDNDQRAQVASQAFNKGLDYMSYILIPKDPYAYGSMIIQGSYNNGYYWGNT